MIGDDELIRLIDQRIRLARVQDRATGTVVSRDTTGPGCMVMFDGATVATPAKVSGTTFVQPGDRCMLDKYGTSDWLVTNSFNASSFGEGSRTIDGLSGTTAAMTSSSFVDIAEYGSFTFSKAFDLTLVHVQGMMAGFVTTAVPTRVIWAVRLTPITGGVGYTPTDTVIGSLNFNTVSQHQAVAGMRRLNNVPAGTYTVTFRWRRSSGTGNVFADANDTYGLQTDERVRAVTPIL